MTKISRGSKLLFIAVGAIVLVCIIAVARIFYGPNDFPERSPKTLFVSKGQTFASIVDSLEARGIVRDRALFVFVGRILGGTTRMQPGKYVFESGISNVELLLRIREGRGKQLISVTIPEGMRSRDQARILAQTVGIDSARYVGLVYDRSFAHSLGVDAGSLEGYLMPETYGFYWQTDEEDIIRRLVDEHRVFYVDSLRDRAGELAWTTNQVMTLASIIEGETALPEERPVISGVYHNRLHRGMRLEADPTIQFMIEDGPRRVLYSDLKLDHPYNTYRNTGLPPGPVNNPGKPSILAALYPASHRYLFFVANGQGGHWFATNYEDHLRFVRKLRRYKARLRAEALSLTQGGRSNSGHK